MRAVSHWRTSIGGENGDSHDDANVALRALLHAQGVLVDDAVDGEQEGRPREVPAVCGEEREDVRASEQRSGMGRPGDVYVDAPIPRYHDQPRHKHHYRASLRVS